MDFRTGHTWRDDMGVREDLHVVNDDCLAGDEWYDLHAAWSDVDPIWRAGSDAA